MSLAVYLAALCAGGAVGLVTAQLIRPRRGIARRMSPYAELARLRMGEPASTFSEPLFYTEATRRVLGPLAGAVGTNLSRLLGLADAAALEARLRRSGLAIDAEGYRRAHLRWALATPVVLGSLGALYGSVSLTLAFTSAGLVIGARRMPDVLRRATTRRAARMRSDLPTISAILSPKLENRKSLMVAVAEVAEAGSGPVIDDLTRAIGLIAAGYGAPEALTLIALECPEEAAARFYRFLAAATQGGIDLPKALLDLADALRTQRREEVERSAARRQMSMVLPDLAFMAPVLLLFLLAPLPRMLFGA